MVPNRRPYAVAELHGGPQAPELGGTVQFFRCNGSTVVVADVYGLPDSQTGYFGLHIHEGERCTGEDFRDTLDHYNPDNVPHPGHAGDLPPLLGENGRAYLAVRTGRFRGRDVIGKTVVIHGLPDDFTSQPGGNAGTKIGCGEIRGINGYLTCRNDGKVVICKRD